MIKELENLINILANLPGLSYKLARKITIFLLQKSFSNRNIIDDLTGALNRLKTNIKKCNICGNYDVKETCSICLAENRDKNLLCIIADIADLWAIERTNQYDGLYHVLGGTLSAIDGVLPQDLNLSNLRTKISEGQIHEVIIALNPTIDGRITSTYIQDLLKGLECKITRLGYGLPIGGELEYLDENTLQAAFASRTEV